MYELARLVDTWWRTNHPTGGWRGDLYGGDAVVREGCPPSGGGDLADEAAITKRRRLRRSRCEGEDCAALVEFALVSILLCVLLFGIINFGLILSFKQEDRKSTRLNSSH